MKDEDRSRRDLLNDLKEMRDRLARSEAEKAASDDALRKSKDRLCRAPQELERRSQESSAEFGIREERIQTFAENFTRQLVFSGDKAVERTGEERPPRFTGTTVCITGRKSAEEALTQTVSLLRSTLEATADGILVVDRNGRLLAFNQRFLELWRIPESVVKEGDDETALAFVSEQLQNPQEFIERVKGLYSQPEAESFDVLTFKDGRVFERYSRPQNVGEEIVGRVWSFRDVTQRKRVEESLRRSEERYRTVADFTYDWEYWADPDGKLIYISPSCERITGYTAQEFLDDPRLMASIIHPEDREIVRNHFLEVKKSDQTNGHSFDFRIIHRNGKVRWINHACRPVYGEGGRSLGRRACNRDITDRKIAEKTLAENEAKYRAIFNNAAIGIDLVDGEGRFREVNPVLSNMLGYTQDELQELTNLDVTHPEDVEISKQNLRRLVQRDTDSYRLEKRFVRKDGTHFWADLCVSSIRNVTGEHEATIGVITDITRRKSSELALRRLATAVEQAAEAIVITDVQGNIEYVNPACEHVTGYAREELLNGNPRILKSGRHDTAFYQDLWYTINRGAVWRGQFINKKKDGSLYHEDATISPVRDANGRIANFVALKRDITEHLTLSRKLVQAQKMEAIGTLAGGIAHDFNNLLQVTMGYSEMLLMAKDNNDADYPDLQRIMQAARNGAELVRSLLTFSRKVEPNPVPVNLNKEIRHVEKLLRRTIPRMIEIRLDLAENIAQISADPTQIEQILMNMAVNARDAMPEGGLLTIATRSVTLDDEFCKVRVGARPGDCVSLEISDNGHGMDRATLQHIFEPFYTTKDVGRGTGLGLAMVYGIVKQHGGYIECKSEPAHGTTFNVFLPALAAQSRFDPVETQEMPALGTETILMVDDEEFVRDFGKRVLIRAGYTVLTASNGKEALDVYKDSANGISLVILDLIMPKMGGARCFEELFAIDPKVRVLIASGYSPDGPEQESVARKAAGFLAKPFKIKELLKQVRKVLDQDVL